MFNYRMKTTTSTSELSNFTLNCLSLLTAVENIARRFPDVRQNDIVLSKPLPVRKFMLQVKRHCQLLNKLQLM